MQVYNASYVNGNTIQFNVTKLSDGIYNLHINNSQINVSRKIIISK